MIAFSILLIGLLLLGSLYWLRRGWWRRLLAPIAVVVVALGGYLCWYEHRPIPPAVEETWFEGITYWRDVRQEPRPLIIHVVRVQLDADGIDFLVTPPDYSVDHPLRGQTTSAFLQKHRLQVAINGSFFHPWHSRSPFDYYPHTGDPVSVNGLAMSNGKTYSLPEPGYTTLFFNRDGRAVIGTTCADAVHAISGREVFVREGRFALNPNIAETYNTPEPRTAIALSKDARQLLLFAVDGRQPNYSEGVTLEELSTIIHEHGGWTALHFDGGGSSTLVMEDADGEPRVVNSPIHGRHPPGLERPVANHLGVFAKRR